jgi:hypothetical protein
MLNCFEAKINADGSQIILSEFIISELGEDGGFANS